VLSSPTSAPRSLLMDRARAVKAELHSLFTARRQDLASIAHSLAVMKREQLFAYLGYASVFEYAWDQHRMGKSKVSELIGVSEASQALPRTRAAFDAGALDWTKAREVTKVATPDTELAWLQKAETATADELRAERRGEPVPRRRVLSLPQEAAAEFDQLVACVKTELGVVADWRAVLELMKRGASGQGSEAPGQRLVITQCGTCGEATRESREGPVRVSPAAVDHARCAGEVHDLREEDNEVKRTVPARIRRRVLDRDRRRCQVPNCRAMAALDVHHEDGWEQGHDPDRMITLCWSHHRARHQGLLRVEGSAPGFRVVLLDGEVLGQHPAPFSYENGASQVTTAACSPENGESEVRPLALRANPSPEALCDSAVADASLALQSLGFKASEAKRHLGAVLAVGRVQPWTATDLVGAALRAS